MPHCSTFATTEWRNKYRKAYNDADNEQNQKAVDALLKYGAPKLELRRVLIPLVFVRSLVQL